MEASYILRQCNHHRRKMFQSQTDSRRSVNHPQDPGHDMPTGVLAEHYCLILAVFRLQNVELGIAAEARNAQASFLARYNHNLSVQMGTVGLRGVHGGDIAIMN